jgi:hypothetical protein
MRQLTRTEKQLLSIYAIFQQMERSGATGDLAATMESFANQSRVAKERMQDILSYSGLLITNFLQTSGIMKGLNAILIFVADTLEAVVEATGAAKNFERGDLFGDITDSAYGASDAVDELNGKLLGFDKFRSLNDSPSEGTGIDAKLIEGLSSYQSILANAKMEATEIANQLKIASGLFNEDGTFNSEKLEEYKDILVGIGIALGAIFGVKSIANIAMFSSQMVTAVETLLPFISTLWAAISPILIVVGAIALIASGVYLAVQAFRSFTEGEVPEGLYYVAGAILAIGAAIALLAGGWIPLLIAGIVAGITALIGLFKDSGLSIGDFFKKLLNTIVNRLVDALNWIGEQLTKFFGWIGLDWELGKIGHINVGDVGYYANGGLPDKGSMFIAGEAGAEYVYNMPNGQSGVANVQQIAQATYQGTMSALRDWWGGTGAKGDIPQLREASATGMYQAVTGVAKSYGERWDKY